MGDGERKGEPRPAAVTWRTLCVVAVAMCLSLVAVADVSAWNWRWRWPEQQQWELLDVRAGGTLYRAYSFDGHVHTARSRDAIHPPEDVLRLAELADLDIVVFTDHGSAHAVDDLRAASSSVRRVVGQEVGGDYGHAVVWNVPRVDGLSDAVGSLRTLGEAAHAVGGLLVLAHPGWWIGNRSRDPRRWMSWEALRRGGISESVDAIELWNGVYPRHEAPLIADWDALLAAGLYVPLVANSDFHRYYTHDLGTPRNVFFCPAAERGEVDVTVCLVDAVRRGRLYATDGPVVAFTLADELPGAVVRAEAGAPLAVEIRARSADGGELRLVSAGAVVQRAALEPGRVHALHWTVSAPSEDGGFRVEIHRPVVDTVGGHADPHVPFSLITNPVRVDVGEARTDGWRGPPVAGPLPPPRGFHRLSGSDRFQRDRFLTPVVGRAPTRPELMQARASLLRQRRSERLSRREAQIRANNQRP